jgi:hypothetical protein
MIQVADHTIHEKLEAAASALEHRQLALANIQADIAAGNHVVVQTVGDAAAPTASQPLQPELEPPPQQELEPGSVPGEISSDEEAGTGTGDRVTAMTKKLEEEEDDSDIIDKDTGYVR